MTDIQLYNEIGRWIRTFHNRDFFYSRLLKDFQHDCYLKLHGKQVNREYVKIVCRYYPWELIKNTYSKRMRTHREFVPLDPDGNPYLDFPDHSTIPNFEFEKPRTKSRNGYKDARRVRVLYRNGLEEVFNSVKCLGEALELKEFRVLYRYIGKPLTGRFTKRKMSHINVINYAD